jgi:hypothetical protein
MFDLLTYRVNPKAKGRNLNVDELLKWALRTGNECRLLIIEKPFLSVQWTVNMM